MSGVSERISDLGYAVGWRLVRALPEKVAVTLFDRGADFAVRNADRNSCAAILPACWVCPPRRCRTP